MKQNHDDARKEERDGVADSPERAHERRDPQALSLADDCGDGREVVCLDRVLET